MCPIHYRGHRLLQFVAAIEVSYGHGSCSCGRFGFGETTPKNTHGSHSSSSLQITD